MPIFLKTVKSSIGQVVLASALLFFIAGLGCAARVTYYDADHHDYHRWDNHEITIYRSYWDGRHESYREYSTLSPAEQRDYWNWRHNHS